VKYFGLNYNILKHFYCKLLKYCVFVVINYAFVLIEFIIIVGVVNFDFYTRFYTIN